MEFSKDALIEATKEFFRVVVIAIIPIIISNLTDETFNWKVVAITATVAGLKFIDSFLHENNKELPKKEQNDGYLGKKGITF